MNRSLLYLLLICLFTSCSVNGNKQVIDLSPVDFFHKMNQQDHILLDVRTAEEIGNGFIKNASFIDFYDDKFREKASWIKKDAPVFVYCHAGGRSAKAAAMLMELGQEEVYNLSGGITSWKNSGMSIETNGRKVLDNEITYTVSEMEELIRGHNKFLMVLKTPWCLPCKKLIPVLNEFKKQNPEIFVLDLNMDANSDIAKHYDVTSIPTLLYFKNSDPANKHTGFISLNDLTNLIK